jgi:hypothetical protein
LIRLFKISGDSLYPFKKDAEIAFCYKVFRFTKIKESDIVVFEKQEYGLMIKKVKWVQDDKYFVIGTDPMSIDSRNFGTIERNEIKYKLLI